MKISQKFFKSALCARSNFRRIFHADQSKLNFSAIFQMLMTLPIVYCRIKSVISAISFQNAYFLVNFDSLCFNIIFWQNFVAGKTKFHRNKFRHENKNIIFRGNPIEEVYRIGCSWLASKNTSFYKLKTFSTVRSLDNDITMRI